MKITVITHYSKNDEDCDGDYHCIEVVDESGKQIADYEDYYHDKGEEKVAGFIAGLKYMLGDKELLIKYEKVADSEY